MKVIALVILAGVAHAELDKVTPVQKVIQLMQGMLEKGKKEKHEEAVQFAAFKQFCDDTTVEKTNAIKEANDLIAVLKADIQKYAADAERLTLEIKEHEEIIASSEADVKAATKVRETERADYETTHADYSESVDALERAIEVLKKVQGDKKQASFAQIGKALQKMTLIPPDAKKAIDLFLAQDPPDEEQSLIQAPEANAYESQTGGIVEMLQKLLDKFVDERTALEKEEMNKKAAFDMVKQDLTGTIEQNTAARDEKAEEKAQKLEAKAEAESTLADTIATRDDDAKYLEDLVATCEQKSSDFESRQKLRGEELVAIEKAIEIISSPEVSGAADKHLPGFVQVKSGLAQIKTSFAQLRSSSDSDKRSPVQSKVATYLRAQANTLNSRILAALAIRVEADPFKKIKKMIKDLITRLLEEANEEAEQKAWCDAELGKNEVTRKEKTEAVELLTAEIDKLEAEIAKLTEEISDLTKAVAELDAAVAKATKLREEEKAKNAETIEDAKTAQKAVEQALQVLKDFYEKAGDATALLQQQPEAPEIFDKPYKGMGGESGGVLGMLEVILSDFARLEADTKAAEEASQAEYDKFMTDSTVDKEQKTQDIKHKTKKKQDASQALEEKNVDLDGTQKELDAALAYYEKLKPSCVDTGVSYDDRVARRKEEIQSLQEALKILSGEDIA
jgi:cell division septum initiation protein DivIVA